MTDPAPTRSPIPSPAVRAVLLRVLWHLLAVVLAVAAFAAYQHFKVEGPPAASLLSLLAAAAFAFVPLRDLVGFVWRVEGVLLHTIHVLGAIALAIVPLTGAISGLPILTRTALAPFALMGAAQALMHHNGPRSVQQAEALRRFVTTLPQLSALTSPQALRSPTNVQRAVVALSDVLSRAEALGQTELDADPGFQAALRRTTTRVGLELALDAVQTSLDRLPATPTTAQALHSVRAQLATARMLVAHGEPIR
jgi:hypothetical protein